MSRLPLVLVALVFPVGLSAGDTPKSAVPLTAAESLFLLYALDDFYRDTWAEPRAGEAVWHSGPVADFIARRSAVVGDLSQYLRGRGAPAELPDAYADYLEFLRSGNELTAKLRDREDKHLQFYRELRQRLLTSEQQRQLESNLDVLHAATDAIRGLTEGAGADPLGGLMSGQAGGLVAARVLTKAMENKVAAARIEDWERAKRDAADYEREEGPTLRDDLAAIRAEFLLSAEAERRRRAESGQRAGRSIAGILPHLTAGETAFLPEADDRPGNPFALKRALAGRLPPTTAQAAEETLALVGRCLAAAEAIPAPPAGMKHDPYRPFRAQFAATAGEAAQVSARFAAGGGFNSAAKFPAPNPAADLARKAWQAYRKAEPTGRTLAAHREAVAEAYAARPAVAHRIISAAAREAPDYPDPEFWYDAARISLAAGKPPAGAAALLGKAVRRGFDDLDRARTDPDLEALRQWNRLAFEKLFTPAD